MKLHIARTGGQVYCGVHLSARRVIDYITEEEYDAAVANYSPLCVNCDRSFRYSLTERGFLFVSRFAPREFPQAIWLGDEVIVGPFCVHCGNPLSMHGPGARCRNHRIHPILPPGDLPRKVRSTA